MFGLFTKKRPSAPELVFVSRRALLARLEQTLASAQVTPLVVCAFELSLSTLEAELAEQTCDRATTGASLLEKLRRAEPKGSLLTATTSTIEGALPAPQGLPPVHVLALERHPLRTHDDALEAFVEQLGNGSRVTFLLSLDDPFFTRFGGSNLKGLMERLGMGDEPVDHPMISKSIASAQAKLAKAVPRETHARSAEEWYRANGIKLDG